MSAYGPLQLAVVANGCSGWSSKFECLLRHCLDVQNYPVRLIWAWCVLQWRWGAGQHPRGYAKLSADVQISHSPQAMHTPTKHIMEPLLMTKIATAIDVTPRSHDAQNGAADPSSKQRIRLGQDHTLWQAWSTQDYWYASSRWMCCWVCSQYRNIPVFYPKILCVVLYIYKKVVFKVQNYTFLLCENIMDCFVHL